MLHGLGKVIVSLLTVTLFAWAGTMPGTRFEYGSNQVFSNADTSARQTIQPQQQTQQQPQLGLDTNAQKSSVSLSDQPSEARNNTIPENPTEQLPDKVDTSIPDSATLVSPDYAVTQQGELKNVETGTTVTDTKLVGTVSKPADPLAKTEGKSFIPVPLSTLKDAVENKDSKNSTALSSYKNQSDILAYPVHNGTETSEASVFSARAESGLSPSDTKQNKTEQIALGNNEYGAYWGTYGGTPAFFESNGTLFAQQAKGVVDVSQWQGTIDWAKAKAAGVEGAIIRISFGWGNGFDPSALRNISECKRLGIPFGIYSYSYAYDSSTGAAEGADMVSLLKQAGVSPNDLSYPVFYDLENWTWAGHAPPTNPSVYEGIVNAWYAKLQAGGYNNLSVYSYTSYLNTSLNAPSIRAKTRWVASYGARTGFPYSTNDRGWQYTSSGTVAGINGSVDLNAFGNYAETDNTPPGLPLSNLGTLDTSISEGDYYLAAIFENRFIDVAWAGKQDGAIVDIWSFNGADNQKFHLSKVDGSSYKITSINSGKVLDAKGPSSSNGTAIIQYQDNNSNNQQWRFIKATNGNYYIQSVYAGGKNRVIDLTGSDQTLGTPLTLWGANGGKNQQFQLIPVASYMPNKNGWVTVGEQTFWYKNGFRVRYQEIYNQSKWYWVGSDGIRAVGWTVLPDGRKVYYDPKTSAMVYNEQQIGSNWFYFDSVTGANYRGWKYLPSNGGKWVYYSHSDGRMLYGEQYIDSNWYLFNSWSGAVTYGWTQLSDGRTVYYEPVYGWMVKGWKTIEGRNYYFNPVTGALL